MVVFYVRGFIFFHHEFLKVEMLLILWQKLGRWQKKELSLSPASKTTLVLKLGYFRLLLFFYFIFYISLFIVRIGILVGARGQLVGIGSLSTMCVWGLSLFLHAYQQVPLPTEPSSWLAVN